MTPRTLALLAAALLPAAACTPPPYPPDTARMAPGQLGTGYDPDVASINQAQWAFALASRTRGRPIEAARAVAGLDYMAGELTTSPRWANVSAISKQQMLQARVAMRQVVGIAPGAPSQAVVDGLTAAGNALAAGNQPAALAALSSPAFPAGPEATLRRLSDLPYVQIANVATQHAAGELFDSNSGDQRF